MSLVIVNSAVDSLYFSYKGSVGKIFIEILDEFKDEAQRLGESVPFYILTEPMIMKPYGAGMFRYNMASKDFFLKSGKSLKLPLFMVQMLAPALYQYGHTEAFNRVDRLLREVCEIDGRIENAKLSRIDLCADIQGWQMSDDRLHDFVCRANQKGAWWQGREPNGFQFGKGNIMARIYNKTKEIDVHNKNWMEAVWQECPVYDQSLPVWRVEFQFRRPALTEFDIDTVEDAFDKLAALWQYGIKDWLSLRVGKASRIERRPVDENWQALNNAFFPGKPADRVKRTKAFCDMERALSMITGYAITLGAIWNNDSLINVLTTSIAEIERKCAGRGSTFTELVQKKIALLEYEQI